GCSGIAQTRAGAAAPVDRRERSGDDRRLWLVPPHPLGRRRAANADAYGIPGRPPRLSALPLEPRLWPGMGPYGRARQADPIAQWRAAAAAGPRGPRALTLGVFTIVLGRRRLT